MDLEQLNKEKEYVSEMMVKYAGFGLMIAKKDPNALLYQDKYYMYKQLFEKNRHKISRFLDSNKEVNATIEKTQKTKVKREITSTTYIRAQNRLYRDHDRYFGRGMGK